MNMANKEILLKCGKFVPVSKATLMNVRFFLICGCNPAEIHRLSARLYELKLDNM
jgi:hypothetical protein